MISAELARAGFEAFNRGDIAGVLRLLDPEVEVHSVAEVGEAGTYHGHQGYLDWTRIWLDAWSEFRVELEEIEQVDDENVLVHTRQRGRGKGSGLEVEQSGIYLFTVRDGLAVRLHLYADRDQALAAARS
jgi:ketosteroid isomerase-like protein